MNTPFYTTVGDVAYLLSMAGITLRLDESPPTGVVTGASNASPIVITSNNHGLATGNLVTITGISGNEAANGQDWSITVLTANTFSLVGSTGTGGYAGGGTWTATQTGNITAATNAAPIQITSVGHSLGNGDLVEITGVNGNTLSNGLWVITVVDANNFTLNGSIGNGTYVSGGQYFAIGQPESSFAQWAVQVACAKVNTFCQPLYDPSDLAMSTSVWEWATNIGAHRFCARRANPIPGSISNLYLETLDLLEMVKKQQLVLDSIAYRNEVLPNWSALRMDQRWAVKKMRVEPSLSGRTPTQFSQKIDLASQLEGQAEPNYG